MPELTIDEFNRDTHYMRDMNSSGPEDFNDKGGAMVQAEFFTRLKKVLKKPGKIPSEGEVIPESELAIFAVEPVEYVKITMVNNKDIHYAPVNDEHKVRFSQAYSAFKAAKAAKEAADKEKAEAEAAFIRAREELNAELEEAKVKRK